MNHSGKEPGEEYWSFIEPIWEYDGLDFKTGRFVKAADDYARRVQEARP